VSRKETQYQLIRVKGLLPDLQTVEVAKDETLGPDLLAPAVRLAGGLVDLTESASRRVKLAAEEHVDHSAERELGDHAFPLRGLTPARKSLLLQEVKDLKHPRCVGGVLTVDSLVLQRKSRPTYLDLEAIYKRKVT